MYIVATAIHHYRHHCRFNREYTNNYTSADTAATGVIISIYSWDDIMLQPGFYRFMEFI